MPTEECFHGSLNGVYTENGLEVGLRSEGCGFVENPLTCRTISCVTHDAAGRVLSRVYNRYVISGLITLTLSFSCFFLLFWRTVRTSQVFQRKPILSRCSKFLCDGNLRPLRLGSESKCSGCCISSLCPCQLIRSTGYWLSGLEQLGGLIGGPPGLERGTVVVLNHSRDWHS